MSNAHYTMTLIVFEKFCDLQTFKIRGQNNNDAHVNLIYLFVERRNFRFALVLSLHFIERLCQNKHLS